MFLRLLFLALVLSAVYAAVDTDEGVYVLTKDNFDDFVKNEAISLVEFYAPWCGHCKKLTPEYAKAAAILKNNDPAVKLAKVDATVESELGTRFGVTGYPTLKVFRRGTPTDYKGPRDAAGIVSYMTKQAAPSITIFKTPADVEKFIQDEAAVVFFGDASSKLYKTFEQLAEKQREAFRFGRAEAKEILDKYNHNDEIVLLQSKKYTQSPLETAEFVVQGSTDSDLLTYIQSNILPIVGEITNDNQNLYSSRGKPVVKLYSDVDWKLNSKGANYVMNRLRKAAKGFTDKFSFAVASKKAFQKEMEEFGLKGDLPFAIHDIKKGLKYPAPDAFSLESLKKHLEDFVGNKLEAYIKSAPVPENQPADEPVVVVGKTFDQIVMDPTKDVLIEAYAPWCGHCKSLEPKYKELAQKMSKYKDSLVIAKIDATANDMPPDYTARGYPTIFFAPANKKHPPMQYDGPREVNDFVNYIKKNAHLPLKAGKDEL